MIWPILPALLIFPLRMFMVQKAKHPLITPGRPGIVYALMYFILSRL